MRGDGSIYKRGSIWWVVYYLNGVQKRKSSGTRDEEQALRFLQECTKEDEYFELRELERLARRMNILIDSLSRRILLFNVPSFCYEDIHHPVTVNCSICRNSFTTEMARIPSGREYWKFTCRDGNDKRGWMIFPVCGEACQDIGDRYLNHSARHVRREQQLIKECKLRLAQVQSFLKGLINPIQGDLNAGGKGNTETQCDAH